MREIDGFEATDRFRIRRKLGSGAMGVVYEVFDRDRAEIVALKTLQSAKPELIYRFKREFRTLVDISHANLVPLYELFAEEGKWFFTMELVRGTEFADFIREFSDQECDSEASTKSLSGLLREDRLRPALRQLAEGVFSLHRAQILHRDLKPSNVLVTPEGRVVILDFGLSVAVTDDATQSFLNAFAGTLAYVAPEVATEATPTSACDWYSVGVMLYQGLTGHLPFSGGAMKVLLDKQTREAPDPRSYEQNLPSDLVELCADLLNRDPAARPHGDEILDRLGSSEGAEVPSAFPTTTLKAFVGRKSELEALHHALDRALHQQSVWVYCHGPSGIGKTTLVQQFLDNLPEDFVVLRGRCFVRESVPYKALDGVMDSLARFLMELSPGEVQKLLPQNVSALCRLFPALLRSEVVKQITDASHEILDPRELRRQAFRAMGDLIANTSERYQLVVHVDDLQWADAESALWLDQLRSHAKPPRLLLISSFRSEEIEARPFLGKLLEETGTEGCRELVVRRLDERTAFQLAMSLLPVGEVSSRELARAVVAEAEGSPFLIDELARYLEASTGGTTANVTLVEMLNARLRRLPAEAQNYLRILAVCGRPMDAAFVHRTADLAGDERPLLKSLEQAHLVRASISANRVEFFHDRLRESLVEQLPSDSVIQAHLRIARQMELEGSEDAESLFEHFMDAGKLSQAAQHGARAAEHLAEVFAFERAAHLYSRVLDLIAADDPKRAPLTVGLADALANAGRGKEAAENYLAASEIVTDDLRFHVTRRAAEELLRGGYVTGGLEVIGSLLDAVGLRLAKTPRRALLRLLARRALLKLTRFRWRARPPGQVSEAELRRIDICWSVSAGLARIDYLRAADFQSKHLQLALRAGEPGRVAQALGIEAAFVSTAGPRAKRSVTRLLDAEQELVDNIENAQVTAFNYFSAGIAAFYLGDFRTAWIKCEAAEELFRTRCKGVAWETNTAKAYEMASLMYLGEIAELTRRVPERLREARERGDLYAEADVAAGRPTFVWLASDKPDEARQLIADSMKKWSHLDFHFQHYVAMVAQAQIDLYVGDGERARRLLDRNEASLRKSLMLRIQHVRVEYLFLHGRIALVLAAGPNDNRSVARRYARRLSKEGVGWADSFAALLDAGIARSLGDTETTRSRLEAAIDGFEVAGLSLHAAVARFRMGQLLGGAQGANLVQEAATWMSGQQIEQPGRIADLLAPGFSRSVST